MLEPPLPLETSRSHPYVFGGPLPDFGLPGGAVTNRGNQNALIEFLSNAAVALQTGDLTQARHQLEQAMSRTDGCALRGTPGNGPSRNWITTCDAQTKVYPLLVDALAVIAP